MARRPLSWRSSPRPIAPPWRTDLSAVARRRCRHPGERLDAGRDSISRDVRSGALDAAGHVDRHRTGLIPRDETSPPKIVASRGGRRRAAGSIALRRGAILSGAAGAHHRRLSPGTSSDIVAPADRPNGCRSGSASNSSSKTGPARAPISPPKPSCMPRPTARRCSGSRRPTPSTRRFTASSTSNFMRDIAPVASIIRVAAVMMVNPRSGQDGPGVHRLCQGQSGQDQMSSPGIGSANHVFGELFKMMAGVDLVHVPYRGSHCPICSADRCRSRSIRCRRRSIS